MKHLIKYNEGLFDNFDFPKDNPVKSIDPEFFNMVFADIIDDGAVVDIGEKNNYYVISVIEPKIEHDNDIDLYIKSISKLDSFYSELKSFIHRVKDEYPYIEYDFHVDENGENNAWVNTIKRAAVISFYYKK